MALDILRSLFCVLKPTFKVIDACRDDTSSKKDSTSEEAGKKARPRESRDKPIEDNPPPYSPQDPHQKHFLSPSPSLKDLIEKTSTPTIRICPHDNLTLCRFDRILALSHITINGKPIDALPDNSQHRRGDVRGVPTHRLPPDTTAAVFDQNSCRPLSIALNDDCVSNLKGFGTYTYSSHCQLRGLLLSFHWELTPLPAWELQCRSRYSTASDLRRFLKKTGIRLCEHRRIWDMYIVEAVHPLIHAIATQSDPTEQYLAKEGGLDCKECGARIRVYLRAKGSDGTTCRIDTRRWIGKEGGRLVVRGGGEHSEE